jgi:gliding motility-associated-like protein
VKTIATIPALLLTTLLCFLFSRTHAQLQFIQNKGQWHEKVDYRTDIRNGVFFLERNGFTVLLHNEKDLEQLSDVMHGHAGSGSTTSMDATQARATNPAPVQQAVTVRSHAYKVKFLGASPKAQPMPDKMLPTYNNYFIGNDPARWQSDCKIYQGVTYQNIYPNIDVRYYTDRGTLKYDIIVYPGGNIDDIALQYDGIDQLSIRNKELIIPTSVGELKELYPYTYQVQPAGRETLDCKYVLEGKNIVRFKVKGYNPSATVVIDPTLIFCTFTGSTKDNWGYTATPGPDGTFFAGGITFGEGFPTSPGAFSQNFNGGSNEDNNGPYDMTIIKFSADGVNRVYATYLGGAGNEQPHSLIVDGQGNLVIGGRSNSSNYPVKTAQVGTGGKYDIVVTKLNANGTALVGSVKIGGTEDDGVNIKPKYIAVFGSFQGAYDTRRNYGDDARSEVIVDGAGNIYMAACTQSANFPIRNSNIQTSFAGSGVDIKQDGAILKFTADLNTVLFSTYFGGNGNDACFVLSINPSDGNIYVAGGTTSTDLPGDKAGVLSPGYEGGLTDGFVTIIRPDGSAIVKTTYIGTNDNNPGVDGNDLVYGIQFDKFGFPYIMGTTTGNWQALNASFNNPGAKQFIGKLKPDLSAYEYSTMFGTNSSIPNISPIAFLVDRCQNVYVSGWGGSFNNERGYPCAGTGGMEVLVTNDAIQSTTDRKDFFFFVLEKNAVSQLFGSFFGQTGGFDDHVDGGTSRFDDNGIIYQAMCANCGNTPGVFFPTSPGVWSPNNQSVNCNQAAVKIEMNFGGVGASVKATINGTVDTVGCVPLDVRFTDTLAKGKRYIWHYGDGTRPDTTVAPVNSVTHTYSSVGTFRLMLVSIDSTTCNIADTAYINVRVGNNEITPNFNATKTGGCESLTFQFDNTTTAVIPVYKPNSFLWDFGDGTTPQRAGINSVTHTYASPGTYTVTLIADDTTFCNAPDSAIKQVRLAVNVAAQFNTPDKGCQPYTAVFNNTSLGGTDFVWNFGDGTSSTDVNPTHLYPNTGTYTVRLIAIDTSTCNKQDQATFNITVFAVPTADFDFFPKPGDLNKPINFINQAIGANTYSWDFGDGETSALVNPSHLFNASNTFNVCMVAVNAAGCTDTICKPVEARIQPLLDVPTAFTPGRFGANSVIQVQGFGIGKMVWKIYNRWGQLLFETSSTKTGWDGTYKGVVQPMDVYTYTLDVEFTDGKKLRKTGDISLLR